MATTPTGKTIDVWASGSNALSSAQQSAVNAIIAVANKLGVNPRTAVATASIETGGTFNVSDIGDNGSSFGLFQLHKGGELGNLTQQQAFDPTINATTALSVFASQQAKYTDPGLLAAASQRPADPSGYALKVDALYNDPNWLSGLGAGSMSTYTPPNVSDTSGSGGSTITPVSNSVASDIFSGLTGGLPLGDALTRGSLIVFGLALIIVALHAFTSTAATPAGVVSQGGSSAAANVKSVAKKVPTG